MLDKEKINVYSYCRGANMKLSTVQSRSSNSRGFTLVEMLIVVALIAALAVGLLATLDPIEKIRQGRDQSALEVASGLTQGLANYFTISSAFPWTGSVTAKTLISGDAALGVGLNALSSAGALKDTFFNINTSTRGQIFVNVDITNETMSACFSPGSKKFKFDTAYSSSGVAGSTCGTATSASTCYICVK